MVKLEPHDIDTQPAPLEWSELWDAMKRCEPLGLWVETTESMYDEMLNVLFPAVMRGGGFLVGEAHHDNAKGETIYAGFVCSSDRYFARYLSVRQFNLIVNAQANLLNP